MSIQGAFYVIITVFSIINTTFITLHLTVSCIYYNLPVMQAHTPWMLYEDLQAYWWLENNSLIGLANKRWITCIQIEILLLGNAVIQCLMQAGDGGVACMLWYDALLLLYYKLNGRALRCYPSLPLHALHACNFTSRQNKLQTLSFQLTWKSLFLAVNPIIMAAL